MSTLDQVEIPSSLRKYVTKAQNLLAKSFMGGGSLQPQARELIRSSLKNLSTDHIKVVINWLSNIIHAREDKSTINEENHIQYFTKLKDVLFNGHSIEIQPQTIFIRDNAIPKDSNPYIDEDISSLKEHIERGNLSSLNVVFSSGFSNINVGFDFNKVGDLVSIAVCNDTSAQAAFHKQMNSLGHEDKVFFEELWRYVKTHIENNQPVS